MEYISATLILLICISTQHILLIKITIPAYRENGNTMTDNCASLRYGAWFESDKGQYACACCKQLLHGLLSGWPRRSRSLLAFNAGSTDFVEMLWECGFDVTAQDSDQVHLEQARACLGNRAKLVLASPDHLPFDDYSFDYAIAVAAMEFWENPKEVLTEIKRLTCSGVILIFPNTWSLFSLECRMRKNHLLCSCARPLLRSPRELLGLTHSVFGKTQKAWGSVLPGPTASWTPLRLLRPVNNTLFPLPIGAFVGLRIDFGPLYTGTPLPLRASEPVTGRSAVLGRSGLLRQSGKRP